MAGEVQRIWQRWQAEPAHAALESLAERLDQEFWLVGGAVRDALLGLPVRDWDLALPDARPLAHALGEGFGCRPALLHEDLPTYRLVVPGDGGPVQFDLVQYRADTIAADLLARDFSVNSLAAHPPTHQLLDPTGGLEDLRRGVIRTPGPQNLRADPLRCLRAYRFHSQFGFTLDGATRAWLRETAPLLPAVAGERRGEELLRLLTPPRAAATLELLDEDGVLAQLLPEIEPTRGVQQGGFHHRDVWGHTLAVVARLEEILVAPEDYFPRAGPAVVQYLQRPGVPAVLLLTALLHDLAKPLCRQREAQGWWRFPEHDARGAQMAGEIGRRLALRSEHTALLRVLIGRHMRPLQLANLRLPRDGRPAHEISLSALRRLFRDAHPDGLGLVLLGLADARGCCGPATLPGYHEALARVLDEMLVRYLDYQAQRPQQRLLTGADLIAAGYRPGRAFGVVLEAVEDAYADGLVRNHAEALVLAARLLESAAARAGDSPAPGEPPTVC